MQTVSIIRNRGQLTIPESIRRKIDWVDPMSAVSISLLNTNEIVIKPHKAQLDWNRIWAGIEKSRALRGKGRSVSAVNFLADDRMSH
jgi:bifunctional DNA-binding transcriptional regulator/antitoxin component of YhaV-PrlF toxin-antitoxin module